MSRSVSKVSSLEKARESWKRLKKSARELKEIPILQPKNRCKSGWELNKMHGICKMVLFYKEEMKIAIRGETFQFEQNVKKWSRVEQNARNLQKGPFLQGRNERRDPWRKFSVWKEMCKSWWELNKICGICKRVLFYKEEMDIAVGKSTWKLKSFESFGKKCARVEKKTYFYNLKTDIQNKLK